MTQDEDERLASLLRADAPPERDAMFRLAVLERRERRRFERRSLMLAMAAVVVAAVFGLGFGMGADLAPTLVAVLIAAGLVAACLLSVPAVREMQRRLRGGGEARKS